MKKVSSKREELKTRRKAILRSGKKFQLWGIALAFIGIGLSMMGFVIGVFIYFFGFGLMIFSLLSHFMAWRLKKKIKGT